jgi:hypothetical protein
MTCTKLAIALVLISGGCSTDSTSDDSLGDPGKADSPSTSVCGVQFDGGESRGVGEVSAADLDPRLTANRVASELNADLDCQDEIDRCVVPQYSVNEDGSTILVEIGNSEIVRARLLFVDFELVAEQRGTTCTITAASCQAIDTEMRECVEAQLRGDGLEHAFVPDCTDPKAAQLTSCCQQEGDDFGYCHHVAPPIDLEIDFSFLSTPTGVDVGTNPEFVGEAVFGHFDFDGAAGDERFTPYVLTETLRTILSSHEEFCSTIPLYGQMDFQLNSAPDSFVSFLRTGTTDWDTRMSEEQIVALEAFLDEQGGQDNVSVFFGRTSVEDRCGFSETSYNLIWNHTTDDVLYLGLHPIDGV